MHSNCAKYCYMSRTYQNGVISLEVFLNAEVVVTQATLLHGFRTLWARRRHNQMTCPACRVLTRIPLVNKVYSRPEF